MTTPTERARALRMVPDAMWQAINAPAISERRQAYYVLLRHYPTTSELDAIIEACPELLKEAGS